MAEEVQTGRARRRVELTREEITLGKRGALSAEDSQRLLEYLEGDDRAATGCV